MSGKCVFCAIADGSGPAHLVYEDAVVVAFLDIRPISRGHTLVVPRAHAPTLADMSAADGAHLFGVVQRVARALRFGEADGAGTARTAGIGADAVNVVINDGRAAFQTVSHTHVHLIPRNHRDVFRFASGLLLRRGSDLPDVAAEVRRGLSARGGA